MTFREAGKFMDENASDERRVSYACYNELTNNWIDFKDTVYFGGRKVYEKGELYIIDPDYRNMWKPESQQWHLWCDVGGKRMFIQSFKTEEQAVQRRDFLQSCRNEHIYFVEPSDIKLQ